MNAEVQHLGFSSFPFVFNVVSVRLVTFTHLLPLFKGDEDQIELVLKILWQGHLLAE
jgi:hypothetical protein